MTIPRGMVSHPNRSAPAGQRWCPKCQSYKFIEDFHISKKFVIDGYCKPCRSKYQNSMYYKYGQRKKPYKRKNLLAPKGKLWCCFCESYKPKDEFYYNRNGNTIAGCKVCRPKVRKLEKDTYGHSKQWKYDIMNAIRDIDGRATGIWEGPPLLGRPFTLDSITAEIETAEHKIHEFLKWYRRNPPEHELFLKLEQPAPELLVRGSIETVRRECTSQYAKLENVIFHKAGPIKIFICEEDNWIRGFIRLEDQADPNHYLRYAFNSPTNINMTTELPDKSWRGEENDKLFKVLEKHTRRGVMWINEEKPIEC